MFTNNIPQRDLHGGQGADFCPGKPVIHDIVHHELPQPFDVERVLTEQ